MSAVVEDSDGDFVQDHAVHKFLESERNRRNLTKDDFGKGVHFSKEFYENATIQDIEDAKGDIDKNYHSCYTINSL